MTSILIRKWNKNGFTLLEIVISLGLITIALLAVLRLQAQNLNLQSLGYLSFSKQVLSEFKQILPAFIHYHLGKRTKSGDFLNKLSHVRV